jgi:Na+-transporting methylmalonyl-CoA/oxaloacetate decarboxylase gamma subunit
MATIVNNPAPTSDSSGSGMMIGLVVLIILAIIVWFWGVPMMRRSTSEPTQNNSTQMEAPENNNPGTTIQVPDQIDVNVNQGE